MNIVWKRPDGGVSVTHMTPDSLAAMERGAALAPLAAQREQVESNRAAAVIEMNRLTGLIPKDEEPIAEIAQAMNDVAQTIALADSDLAKIADHDFIVQNIGLSLAAHAAIIQARAQADWDKALALDPAAQKPEVLDWVVVAESIELPATRDWRGAWSWTTDDPSIDICPVRAAEVTKQRLRRERSPLMAELDVAYFRALEAGDTSAVVAEKDRLRNITALVDAVPVGDLDALAAISCT